MGCSYYFICKRTMKLKILLFSICFLFLDGFSIFAQEEVQPLIKLSAEKDTYEVYEPFSAVVNFFGNSPERYLGVVEHSRSGVKKKIYSKKIFSPWKNKNGYKAYKTTLSKYIIQNDGHMENNFFIKEGYYKCKVLLYSCSGLAPKVGLCDALSEESLTKIVASEKPEAKAELRVNIKGGSPPCIVGSECQEPCDHCLLGAKKCAPQDVFPIIKCLDCTKDSDCKDGYACVNNTCLEKKEPPPTIPSVKEEDL